MSAFQPKICQVFSQSNAISLSQGKLSFLLLGRPVLTGAAGPQRLQQHFVPPGGGLDDSGAECPGQRAEYSKVWLQGFGEPK